MNENLTCPHCGTPNDIDRGLYCTKCGNPILNFCTNENCENSDAQNATIMCSDHYCPLCGSVTLFEEKGLLSD